MRRAVMLGLSLYLCTAAWWLVGHVRQVGHDLTAVIAIAMAMPEPPRSPCGITFIEYGG